MLATSVVNVFRRHQNSATTALICTVMSVTMLGHCVCPEVEYLGPRIEIELFQNEVMDDTNIESVEGICGPDYKDSAIDRDKEGSYDYEQDSSD